MTRVSLSQFGLDRPESGDDTTVPFTLEELGCRGRTVRLAAALDVILRRHDLPAPVARLLGEALVLAALVGSSLKFEGRFILQTRTDGPVNLIVVDLDAPDGLRGYARYDHDALTAAAGRGDIAPGQLLGKGHLAMTVDQGAQMERYQGVVALNGQSLEEAARTYFAQSEQTPTLVRLAVAEHKRKGDTRLHWRAGGLLVQHLPKDQDLKSGDLPFRELPGDGGRASDDGGAIAGDDNWTLVEALLGTLGDHELVDPDVSAERLLFRLFHEGGVRVFRPEPLNERCTCSAGRIEDMLQNSFTADQREDMTVDGEIEVVCEFCATAYHFNPHQFDETD